jgi:hypothetical protein
MFWGTQMQGLLLARRGATLWKGTQWCKGGTRKAEGAKLQAKHSSGLSPSAFPAAIRPRWMVEGIHPMGAMMRTVETPAFEIYQEGYALNLVRV